MPDRPRGAPPPDDLLAATYDDLRRVAARFLGAERRHHTLQPTALVHEAYLRLADRRNPFESRLEFINAAAGAMRHILVDHARAARALKRGGDWRRCDLTVIAPEDHRGAEPLDLLALDEALQRLERLDPCGVQIILLWFFGGLTHAEIARLLERPHWFVENRWRASRAWLHKEMSTGAGAA